MTEAQILIVEDEEGLAFYLQYLVRRMGHKPLEPVGTGRDAVDRAIELCPDLILMDICLEGNMSGIDAARQILDVYQVPVIYLTAVASDEVLHDVRESHPYAYLEKPVQERELRAAIDLALYKHSISIQLQESEQRYRLLFETMSSGFSLQEMVLDDCGGILDVRFLQANPAFEKMTGLEVPDLIGRTLKDVMKKGSEELIAALKEMVRTGEAARWQQYIPALNKYLEITAFTPRPGQVATVVADVTEQVLSKKAIEQNLMRLTVLRKIDQAITTHTDMVTMASVVLNHITELPEVDAALLFDGHHLPAIRPETSNGGSVRLVGVAGVPLETLDGPALAWLRQQADQAVRAKLPTFNVNLDDLCPGTIQLKDELGFSVCAFLPVASKGQMMGVLALLGCLPCVTDPEQQQFFQSLSLQTAIAMDNVAMFRGIIDSHEKLSQAYEATIRGWAGALELRDKETRGHSERVVRLATRLARRLGMGEEDMVHFQRGVLLHDIGKMAIPDSVLLKPGKLTEEEWILMRQHPRYAFDMLKEIEYLRPALDVPFCHHEKWDGTGYPRGLKGEQIPYMARIFSVVDAWDALTSERPYRPAWTYDDARDYLIKQSGKQFDPQVMQVFLTLISQDSAE